jgi:hypothetical protein
LDFAPVGVQDRERQGDLKHVRFAGGQVSGEAGDVGLAQVSRYQGDDSSSDEVLDLPAKCGRQRPGHRDDAIGLVGCDDTAVGVVYLADVPVGQRLVLPVVDGDGEAFLVGAWPGRGVDAGELRLDLLACPVTERDDLRQARSGQQLILAGQAPTRNASPSPSTTGRTSL